MAAARRATPEQFRRRNLFIAEGDLRRSFPGCTRDRLTRIEASLRVAVETAAAQRHLRPDWLNDHAAAFTALGLTVEICEVLYQHTNLLVLGPPPLTPGLHLSHEALRSACA
jgi:hypothetical protein